MAFYARPGGDICPGDIFPEIPITTSIPPVKVSRPCAYVPPVERGVQEFRRIYTLPDHATLLNNLAITTVNGEETVSKTRVGRAIFLGWGSQVEADERYFQEQGRAGGKV